MPLFGSQEPSPSQMRPQMPLFGEGTSRSPSVKNTYGSVVIPIGTQLYHKSSNPITYVPGKTFIFTAVSTSEWNGKYLARITVIKEIRLAFLIDPRKATRTCLKYEDRGYIQYKGETVHQIGCREVVKRWYNNDRLEYVTEVDENEIAERVLCPRPMKSLLGHLVGDPTQDLLKRDSDAALLIFAEKLKEDGLSGWISTIEGRGGMEVVLFNDPSLWVMSPSELYERKDDYVAAREVYDDDYENFIGIVDAKLSTRYPITSIPFRFYLNSEYKNIIDEIINEKYLDCTPFSVVVRYATITYFKAPLVPILWFKYRPDPSVRYPGRTTVSQRLSSPL
jgi:hypothetical protein